MHSLKRFAIPGGILLVIAAVLLMRPSRTPAPSRQSVGKRPVAAVAGSMGMLTTHERTPGFDDPAAPSASNVSHRYRQKVAVLEARVLAAQDDTTALAELAGLYFDAHAMETAVERYQAYLVLRPKARQHWLDLATAQASLGRWAAASEATKGLLAHYPDDPAGLYNMGVIAANQSDINSAAEWLHRAIESDDSEIVQKARATLARLTSPN